VSPIELCHCFANGLYYNSARRAHPVRGKGRAHLKQNNQGYEPTFNLNRADSRRNHERKFVMDIKELPTRPSLEQYKKQAKDLVKAYKSSGLDAIRRIKNNHPRLDKLPVLRQMVIPFQNTSPRSHRT
jgi:hypothetical protein